MMKIENRFLSVCVVVNKCTFQVPTFMENYAKLLFNHDNNHHQIPRICSGFFTLVLSKFSVI